MTNHAAESRRLRPFELIAADEKINSSFEVGFPAGAFRLFLSLLPGRRNDEPRSACGGGYVRSNQTQIKITGLPPEKRGQVIKSYPSEKNAFAVTGENKNIICETGKGTQSARTRKCQFSYPFLYFKSWNRFRSYIPSVVCTPPPPPRGGYNKIYVSEIHLLQIHVL